MGSLQNLVFNPILLERFSFFETIDKTKGKTNS